MGPAHLQVLQRWVAQNDSQAVNLCFVEWRNMVTELKMIVRRQSLIEEDAIETARQRAEQRAQMDAYVQRVRATVMQWADTDASLMLKNCWSVWIEFCNDEKQNRESESKFAKQVNETRQ